jgi:hypothetical protein
MSSGLHVQHRYSCPILIKLEFSRQFFENTHIPNFIKILVGSSELKDKFTFFPHTLFTK